jgi:hypothetical protein
MRMRLMPLSLRAGLVEWCNGMMIAGTQKSHDRAVRAQLLMAQNPVLLHGWDQRGWF